MKSITEIERMVADGRLDDALDQLNEIVEAEPSNAQAWILMGGIYRRFQMWGEAINAYNKAKFIDPEGPAAAAVESIYEILHFVNKDLMNP